MKSKSKSKSESESESDSEDDSQSESESESSSTSSCGKSRSSALASIFVNDTVMPLRRNTVGEELIVILFVVCFPPARSGLRIDISPTLCGVHIVGGCERSGIG